MSHSYQVAGASLPKPNKVKNGDAYFILEEESFVLSIVADGVSSTPCDWYASDLVCDTLGDFIRSNFKEFENKHSLIEEGLKITNDALLFEIGKCAGGTSTVCGLLWEVQNENAYIFWVGDSRVYQLNNTSFNQISVDDSEDVVLSKDIKAGTEVKSRSFITNFMGGAKTSYHIQKINFHQGDSLLLASDGFINYTPRFKDEVLSLSRLADFSDSIHKLMKTNYANYKDDTTALLLRRNISFTKEELDSYSQYRQSIKDNFIIIEYSKEFLMNAIQNKNKLDCLLVLNDLSVNHLKFEKSTFTDLVTLMEKNNFLDGEVYQELIRLLQK